MTVHDAWRGRRCALAVWVVACLAAPIPAAAQTKDQKPPPAVAGPRDDAQPPNPPPPGRRPQKKTPGEERPRTDVPVSFPVDI
jgi:hypothetical protein